MSRLKKADDLTTSEAPETAAAVVDDGLVEVTLQGLGVGTSPWRVQPDPDGGIPRVLTVGTDVYDLSDRAAKVYTWRHR
jgi:hypothetical protein